MPNPCLNCPTQNCDTCKIKPPKKCGRETEIFSRCCGYFRPYKMPSKNGKAQSSWNKGKLSEKADRLDFDIKKATQNNS